MRSCTTQWVSIQSTAPPQTVWGRAAGAQTLAFRAFSDTAAGCHGPARPRPARRALVQFERILTASPYTSLSRVWSMQLLISGSTAADQVGGLNRLRSLQGPPLKCKGGLRTPQVGGFKVKRAVE